MYDVTVYLCAWSPSKVTVRTYERPFWEVVDGRLDVFVGDMESVSTHVAGTWYAVAVHETDSVSI